MEDVSKKMAIMANGYLGAVQTDIQNLLQKRKEIEEQLNKLGAELEHGKEVLQAFNTLFEETEDENPSGHEVVSESDS